MSSLGGTDPLRQDQPPGSSCLAPFLKVSSLLPLRSVNGVMVIEGSAVAQSSGSPGPESSAVFPSISKLPTALPAIAAGAAMAQQAATAATTRSDRKNRSP